MDEDEMAQIIAEERKKWDEKMKKYAEHLASKEDFTPLVTPLKPLELCKRQFIQSVLNTLSFDKWGGIPLRAYLLIDKELNTITESEEQLIRVQDQIAQGREKFLESQKLEKEKEKGGEEEEKTFQDIMELSQETMQCIYSLSRKLLAANQMKEYGDLALFLFYLNPYVSTYSLACGIFYQNQREYEEALFYFERAKELNPRSPHALFYAAQCHHELGQSAIAKDYLAQIFNLEGGDPDELGEMKELAQDELQRFSR